MATKIKYATTPKKSDPIHQLHVGNVTDEDSSGYLGLILNVNKNGKAIRVALRDGSQRVHVLLSEVDNFIADLKLLKAQGVAMSVKAVEYDTVTRTAAPKRKRAA